MIKLKIEENNGVVTITNNDDCWKLIISQYSNKGPHIVVSNTRGHEMLVEWIDVVTETVHVRTDVDTDIPTRRRN